MNELVESMWADLSALLQKPNYACPSEMVLMLRKTQIISTLSFTPSQIVFVH